MRKLLIVLGILHFAYYVSAQAVNPAFTRLNSESQATDFLAANPKTDAVLFKLDSGIDTNELSMPLYTKKQGFSFRIGSYSYKILNADSALSFRCSYIYLDGSKLSKNEIDSLRQLIIAKYKEGIYFTTLVQQYNMDGNPTGDTRWFTQKIMVPEFESAVRNHKKGDIFTVDEPEQNWYHVVLKTYNDTYIKTLTLIRLKN